MTLDRAHHHDETEALRDRLSDAEETLRAIREGDIDALIVQSGDSNQVYTLHSAEEPYRTLVEQMREGAVVLTTNGDILYANTSFAALVGEPLESVIGTDIHRFIPASDRTDFATFLIAGSGRRLGTLVPEAAGAVAVQQSLTTTRLATGDRLNLIVTNLSDLLEARSHRERAERDNRTKDEFLAMLAHELRNPIAAITGAVAILEVTHATGGAAGRAHEVIVRQVGHVSRLIDDLLDIERVVSGRIRLIRQPLDMTGIVHRAVSTFAADGAFDWHIEVGTDPVWIDVDAFRFDQVLTNLLTNAVKYTPRGGRIGVTLSVDGDDAVLIVEDSGYGISPELLPHIFDLYVQGDRTLTSAQGGLGIGLTLVRRLVELHGGTIVAASEGERRGSCFTVRMKQTTSTGEAWISLPQDRRLRPRRVLLIEDSSEAHARLTAMLELAGHEVYTAPDDAHGVALLHAVRPEVVVIDMSLPGMDGQQLAERIREQPWGPNMLLLALTGDASLDSKGAGLGFNHHLIKPVNPVYIARLISESTAGGSCAV